MTASGKLNARRHGIRFCTQPDYIEDYDPFGRPGGGAPRVDRGGRVVPAMTKNPELCFTDQLKNEVEISMVRALTRREGGRVDGRVGGWELTLIHGKGSGDKLGVSRDFWSSQVMSCHIVTEIQSEGF